MNKLALALVLALGTANVSAAVETKSVDNSGVETFENRIKSLNLSEENKSAVMRLVSDHKTVTGAIALALAATLFVGFDVWYNSLEKSYTKAGYDAVVGFLSRNIGTPALTVWNDYGFGSTGKDADFKPGTLRAHPVWVGTAVAVVALVIFAAYDLRKEEDKSALKNLYKKYISKKEAVASVA